MSAHALTKLTTGGAAAFLVLVATTAPAAAIKLPDPAMPGRPPAAVTQGPPNYPVYEVHPVASGHGLDTTSVVVGALGGIALGGAGLGIAVGVQLLRPPGH